MRAARNGAGNALGKRSRASLVLQAREAAEKHHTLHLTMLARSQYNMQTIRKAGWFQEDVASGQARHGRTMTVCVRASDWIDVP